ncbi:6-pyruvoyltetrahydropterin/6-carboxytetrahydropterin synthase [Ruminiclostridium sufflavum DSM 19573]|uniref:6-carboxy-5,6,7,8-tetrahydropterin synthase n=1 Tax=Ruminiclostridium sufflavum DSM 19573 TaxID=1121337 RepID=A0A318XNG5_9FIRM|nr:6-carboxytetrahydropterin synthase QueD [Ruminiclostridium sufflavum]PYG87119.1 6-pyruvoyltetrahydropterin/6-carboxytetrahydropterin synthase [Ruminiclostridium sufflavum DSM 19573]
MYTIRVEHSFDSAHFLSGYSGKCSNIHGHRWKVEVEVSSRHLLCDGQSRGMVEDFSILKGDLKELVDYFDHSMIIETGTLKKSTLECLLDEGFRIIEVEFRPTAENFSCFFYDKMLKKGYQVRRATVYETPSNSATYEGSGECV